MHKDCDRLCALSATTELSPLSTVALILTIKQTHYFGSAIVTPNLVVVHAAKPKSTEATKSGSDVKAWLRAAG